MWKLLKETHPETRAGPLEAFKIRQVSAHDSAFSRQLEEAFLINSYPVNKTLRRSILTTSLMSVGRGSLDRTTVSLAFLAFYTGL